MKPLTEKMLKSGIIDRHTAAMMEHFGMLPEGATEQVREDALKDATQGQLMRLADDLLDEVEKANTLRETVLDLERIRWPASIDVYKRGHTPPDRDFVAHVDGVIDRQGRYYFRIQDVDKGWFIPGYVVEKKLNVGGKHVGVATELILESQVLHIDERPVCVQVSTQEL